METPFLRTSLNSPIIITTDSSLKGSTPLPASKTKLQGEPSSSAMKFSDSALYELDPDGDVTLYTVNSPLVRFNKEDKRKDEGGKDEAYEHGASPNVTSNDDETMTDKLKCPDRFLVSSKHLKLASSFFKAMLSNSWAEGRALTTNGTVEIPVTDVKPETLMTSLNAIHGRFRRLPLKMTLQELVDVLVFTDFFKCHEAIELFANE
ncbi:uncharacterized protein N7529_006177 [Penicillium soppii]|uniref:uncharacterized protein n=1 Tax=Penicillium soppii TaxID=69789 RepID=UPI002546A19D|nr:uncharacterized protein N7529_006177 [Penicillium soppii]KAJ5864261.1 hypothetical protein N7529_006177 [Penicillium soppii]